MHQPRGGPSRRAQALVCLALLLTLPAAASARAKANIRIGITTKGWGAMGQDLATWRAAVRPLLDSLSRGVGLSYSLQTVTESKELARKMKTNELNFALTWALDYLRVAQTTAAKPLAVMQWHGKRTTRLVLLVRRDSGISSIADLKGKRFTLMTDEPLTQRYFLRLLRRSGIKRSRDFFSAVIPKAKAQSAVLTTFFKQAEGCLVWKSVIDTMSSLNPQLKRALKPIEVSPPFANPVLFARADMHAAHFAKIRARALTMHQTTAGKQLLMTGRVERLAPVDAALFETTRSLLRDDPPAH